MQHHEIGGETEAEVFQIQILQKSRVAPYAGIDHFEIHWRGDMVQFFFEDFGEGLIAHDSITFGE